MEEVIIWRKLAGVKRKLTRFASEGNGRMPCWFLIIDGCAMLVSDYRRGPCWFLITDGCPNSRGTRLFIVTSVNSLTNC